MQGPPLVDGHARTRYGGLFDSELRRSTRASWIHRLGGSLVPPTVKKACRYRVVQLASLFPFPKGPSSGRAEQHVGRRVDCRSDLASSQSPRSESCVVRPAGDRPKRRSSCTSSSRVSSVWAAFVPVGSTFGRAKARLSRLPCALSAPVAFAWQASTGGGRSSYRCVLRKESGRSPPIRRGLVGAAFSQPDP